METEVIVACNRSWDIRVEDGQVEVKSGIIRTRTVSLGNMCLLQSIGAHSQTIERREREEKEKERQQTRTRYADSFVCR